MESQKDIRNTSQISPKMQLDKLGVFSHDPYSVFIYRKSQSILTALYLVTNYFPDSEPLKWRLREKGTDLLDAVVTLPRETLSQKKDLLSEIVLSALEIISLCEVGSISFLISEMNLKVLRRELENLILILENGQITFSSAGNFVLDEKMFRIPDPSLNKGLPSHVLFKGQTHLASLKGQNGKDSSKGQENLKDTERNPNDRKNSILALLKRDSELSIKDISQVLTDCSEKTIQRGLLRLVEEGLAKKTGERRWSRYSLV